MQATTQSFSGNTIVLITLGIIESVIVIAMLANVQLPLIGNHRVALGAFVIVGVAMCSIGMAIARYGWTDPFNLIGIVLGAAILVIGAAAFFGIQLPLVANERAAILAIAALMMVKIILAGARSIAA